MLRSRLPVLFVVSQSLACAIPERDNPLDPGVGPRAKLSVRVTASDGSVSNEGGRFTEFVLDASESSGGHGELQYAFELSDDECYLRALDSGAFQTVAPDGGSTLSARLPVERERFDADGTGAVARIVCVRVTDSRGHIGIASAGALVRNGTPVADAGGTLFVSGERGPVTLDACGGRRSPAACTSADPESDPLWFRWTLVAGEGPPPVPIDANGRRARFDLPETGDSFRFLVTASDGQAQASGSLTVSVGEQVWASTRFPSRLLRVFPDRARATAGTITTAGLVAFPTAQMGGTFAPGDGTLLLAADGIIGFTPPPIVRIDGAFRALETWYPAPAEPGSKQSYTVTSIAGPCAAVRYDDFGEPTAIGAFVVLPPGGGSPPPAKRDDGAKFGFIGPAGASAVLPRDDGSCFTIGTQIGVLDTAGAWTQLSPVGTSLGRFESAAALPDGRVCVLGENAAGTAALRCLEGNTLAVVPDPLFEFTYARSMAAHPDGTHLLVHSLNSDRVIGVDPETGDVREEPGLPPVSGQFIVGRPIFVSDPATASLWFVDDLSEILFRYEYTDGRWTESGSIVLDAILGSAAPGVYAWRSLAVDPRSGNAIATLSDVSGESTGIAAKIPFHLRSVERLPGLTGERARVAGDPTRGTVWYTDDGQSFNVAGGASVRNDRGEVLAQQPASFFDQKWRPAAAIPTGGAWVGFHEFQSAQDDALLRLDPYFAVEQRIPIGSQITLEPDLVGDLSLSRDGRWLCAATTRTPEGGFGATNQTIWRCDTLAGTCAAVGALPDSSPGASPALGVAPVRVAAANDGSCYFAVYPEPPAGYAMWNLGRVKGSASSVDASFARTFLFNGLELDPENGCSPIVIDPRDESLWLLRRDLDGPVRVETGPSATGAEEVESFPSLGDSVECLALAKRCADGGSAACLDAWYISQESTGQPMLLKRAEGTPLDQPTDVIELGAGAPQSLDVRE